MATETATFGDGQRHIDGLARRGDPATSVRESRYARSTAIAVRVAHCRRTGRDAVDTMTLRRLIRRKDEGSEIIELAIVIPILFFLLLGIVDFAFLFQRWQVVTNATREGARLGSLSTEDFTVSYDTDDVTARVTSYLQSSGLHATPTVGTDFDTTEDVNGVTVQTVTVSVSYPSDFIFLPGSITLHSSAQMRAENGN